jgi:hypothetical protein
MSLVAAAVTKPWAVVVVAADMPPTAAEVASSAAVTGALALPRAVVVVVVVVAPPSAGAVSLFLLQAVRARRDAAMAVAVNNLDWNMESNPSTRGWVGKCAASVFCSNPAPPAPAGRRI